MANKSSEAKQQLNDFFVHIKELGKHYKQWAGAYPTKIFISPRILMKLSNIEGFYQREELRTQATTYAPVIHKMDLGWGVVYIIEDWEEQFLHFG